MGSEPEPSNTTPLPKAVAHEDHPTAAAHPVSEWAIHHHDEGQPLPNPLMQAEPPPPEQAYPPGMQPFYNSDVPTAPPASGDQYEPYPSGGAMSQPYPDAAPAAQQPPMLRLQQPLEQPLPAAPAAYQQPYQQPYAPYPQPYPQLYAQPFPQPPQQPIPQYNPQQPYPQPQPYPQLPLPAGPAASPLQGSGPRLEAPTVSRWTISALLLNAAFLAAAVGAAANYGGRRTELSVAAVLLYLVYLAACLCSPSATALRNHMGTLELLAHTQAVRQQLPSVWTRIVCYHMEQRTRRVSSTVNGKTRTRTEHYTVRVDTHSARAAWGYRWCRDTSGPPVYLPTLPMLEIHFKPVQDFADPGSAAAYHAWRAAFLQANARDQHQEVSDGMEIEGLRPHVMLQQGTSWVVGPGAHFLAVLLGMGIFYECAVFQRTPHTKYYLVKQLSI